MPSSPQVLLCTHSHQQRRQELPQPSTSADAAATARREQRVCRLPTQLHLSGQTPGNSSLRGRQLLPVGLANSSGSTRGRDATGHSPRNLCQHCPPSTASCGASPSLGAKCFSGLGVCLFPEDVWLEKGPGREQTPSLQGAFCHLLLPGRPQPYTLGLVRLMGMNAPYLAAPSSSKLFILSDSKPITNKIFDMTNVPLALREGLTESKAAN